MGRFHTVQNTDYEFDSEFMDGKRFDPKLMGNNFQANDFVLLKVNPAFDFSQGDVRKICLPKSRPSFTSHLHHSEPYNQAGWGQFAEMNSTGNIVYTQNWLTERTGKIQDQGHCANIYSEQMYSEQNHICGGRFGNIGGTPGDSGSPMQINYNSRAFAVGLFTQANVQKLPGQIYPDVFIKTDIMCEFLKQKTGKEICISFSTPQDEVCAKILLGGKKKDNEYVNEY